MKDRLFFDKIFGGSRLWQIVVIVSISVVAVVIFWALFKIGKTDLSLNSIISLYINQGSFTQELPWGAQLIVVLFGFVFFTVLLSAVITAWITNLNGNIEAGLRRYNLSGHAIVFGAGDQLEGILTSLRREGRKVLVVSPKRPEIRHEKFIYYCGRRDDEALVRSTCPDKASVIYIIGEDDESGHDSRSLRCLELLKEITGKMSEDDDDSRRIHCYITFDDEETVEVFQYLKGDEGMLSSRLILVDAINEYEYRAEQFVLNTDFLPLLRKDSPMKAHFILVGTGKVSQAMAYTLCHACHYPKLDGKVRKTCITIVDPDAFGMRDSLILARPHLFRESVYESVSVDGHAAVHRPDRDILDIEWRFVQGSFADASVEGLLRTWAEDPSLDNRIVVCDMHSRDAVPAVLHLPAFVYGRIPVAVYLADSAELIRSSNGTAMYGGNISIFGPASGMLSDPLMKHRSECGQRVNFVYEKAYSTPGREFSTPEDAWYARCEADKLSSIYCAIGLPLREKTFDMETEIEDVYEAEHRRWMMSEYLLGFRYGEKKDKIFFTHNDLMAYEDLPDGEQYKDKILIDNRNYILKGEGEPVI